MRRRSTITRAAAFAVAASAVMASPAAAEPDFKFALTRSVTHVNWDGTSTPFASNVSNQTGDPTCGKSFSDYCDQALFFVSAPGVIKWKGTPANSSTDIDYYLYASDPNGSRGRQIMVDGAEPGVVENVSVTGTDPAFYLLVVNFFFVFGDSYKGEATFEPEPQSGGGGDVNALPSSTVKRPASPARASRLKSFSGTAADDGRVAKVEVALVRRAGSKTCTALQRDGRFKRVDKCSPPARWLRASGTARWSFKLRRRLARGRYVLYSRATDDAGQQEARFTRANHRTFTVR
jgi:hypothetical protein